MGLIASLRKVSSKGANLAEGISSVRNLQITIIVEHHGGKEAITIEHIFQKLGIERQEISVPFVGELFYTGKPDSKIVIILCGSGDGSIAPLSLIAGPLAPHGFNALTVGYFGSKGLSNQLQNVPLEYCEKVISWIWANPLLEHPWNLQRWRTGLIARFKIQRFFKGGRQHAPRLLFPGAGRHDARRRCIAWSYGEEPLPNIKLDNNVFFEEMKQCTEQSRPFGINCCYVKGLELADNKEEARIKIENASADLLLILDEKDMIWNTYDGFRDIMNALKENKYPHAYTLLFYEEMGHVSFPILNVVPISENLHMEMHGGYL